MYAQLVYFDGPRSTDQLVAADFAAQHRIEPALAGVPGLLATYELRRHDGSGMILVFAESEDVLLDAQRAMLATELLPGEDMALLPGPNRVETYPVIAYHGSADIYADRG
ncbi:hypothetical protein ACWEO2_36040 [Nocardia sp. NPDC004278]